MCTYRENHRWLHVICAYLVWVSYVKIANQKDKIDEQKWRRCIVLLSLSFILKSSCRVDGEGDNQKRRRYFEKRPRKY